MKKPIEFVNNTGSAPDPIGTSREAGFKDMTCKEEYRELMIRFKAGLTWLRFLPSIKGSMYSWMMPLDIHADIAGTTFTSPRALDRNAPSVFENAQRWFKRHHPEALYSRDTNENGLKLYSKRVGASWVIEEQAPEGERLRLLIRSLYDGIRGGTTGLAYNIHHEAESCDNEPGSGTVGQRIHGDITEPTAGRLVKIERMQSDKSEYANYKIGIGKNPAPISHFMALLTEKEHNLITPLEKVVYIPTEEEQKEVLRRFIGDKFFSELYAGTEEPTVRGWAPEAQVAAPIKEEAEPNSPVATKTEPTPEPAPTPATTEITAEPAEPAAPAAPAETPYTTKEVTSLLAQEADGVRELLANRGRLNKALLAVVIESAAEFGVEA